MVKAMTRLLAWIDKKSQLMLILFLFWGMFWTLNGADKFFNGQTLPTAAAQGVLRDSSGVQRYTVHSMVPQGFFGVSRDNKMVSYFERLHLPPAAARFCLYAFSVFELILGLGFSLLVVWSWLPLTLRMKRTGAWQLFTDRVIHRLCFKGSLFLFLLFSVGDILFGDRTELWEHGTFMLLTLVTYDMWFRTDQYVSNREKAEAAQASVVA
jgi:hypothetical protein